MPAKKKTQPRMPGQAPPLEEMASEDNPKGEVQELAMDIPEPEFVVHKDAKPAAEIIKALTITPKPIEAEGVPRKRYWIGLRRDCPLDGTNVGGIEFNKRTFKITAVEDPSEDATPMPLAGAVVELTQSHLNHVLECMALAYVENTSDGVYQRVQAASRRRLHPEKVQPLARWAFMCEVADDILVKPDVDPLPEPMLAAS